MFICSYFLELVINGQLSNNSESISLQEEFDSFNLNSLWSHDIYIAQDPVCY